MSKMTESNIDLAMFHILRVEQLWHSEAKYIINSIDPKLSAKLTEHIHVAAFKAKGHFKSK